MTLMPKPSYETPLIAGYDANGPFLSAAWPMDELWRGPRPGGAQLRRDFSNFIEDIVLADVYLDNGRCCVVDLFVNTISLRGGPVRGSVNAAKISYKMAAMWGLMQNLDAADERRRQKWLNVPINRIVGEDKTFGLWRMEAPPYNPTGYRRQDHPNWPEWALHHLRETLEWFYSFKPITKDRYTFRLARGPEYYMTYEGEYAARSVVDYFAHRDV